MDPHNEQKDMANNKAKAKAKQEERDKEKMKTQILDNLKRLVLLNMSLDDVADLYNQKMDITRKPYQYYHACDQCRKLKIGLTEKLSKYDYDAWGNYYHYYHCADCCKKDKWKLKDFALSGWLQLFDFLDTPEYIIYGHTCTMRVKRARITTPMKSYDGHVDIGYTWIVNNVTIHLMQCYATWEKDGLDYMLMMVDGKIDTLHAKDSCTTRGSI